jgi:hypothetical protein
VELENSIEMISEVMTSFADSVGIGPVIIILKEMSQGLRNSKHSIDKSMEFQGPQIAPKVEGILGFHWLIVLHHLFAFGDRGEI